MRFWDVSMTIRESDRYHHPNERVCCQLSSCRVDIGSRFRTIEPIVLKIWCHFVLIAGNVLRILYIHNDLMFIFESTIATERRCIGTLLILAIRVCASVCIVHLCCNYDIIIIKNEHLSRWKVNWLWSTTVNEQSPNCVVTSHIVSKSVLEWWIQDLQVGGRIQRTSSRITVRWRLLFYYYLLAHSNSLRT